MDRWHGKHPIPWDFFNSMSNVAGQDLSWFFQNWFFTNHYIDLAVGAVNGTTLTVQNVGGFAIPFDVAVEYADGSKATLHQSPAVWRANQRQATITLPKEARSVALQGGLYLDATQQDNTWRR